MVGPGVRHGNPRSATRAPREIGPDRLANAVAAKERYGAPCIVVDFGTSTNFDLVSAAGEYVGGVLAPGIEISMDALFARAARLVKVDSSRRPSVIGKTTATALQSGLVYGFAGQVDGIADSDPAPSSGVGRAGDRDRRAGRAGRAALRRSPAFTVRSRRGATARLEPESLTGVAGAAGRRKAGAGAGLGSIQRSRPASARAGE